MNKIGELKPQEDETSSQVTPNSSSDQEKKRGKKKTTKEADRREVFSIQENSQDKSEIICNLFREM